MLDLTRSFLRNLFQRDRNEARMSRELESYVELLAAEHERAGMPPSDARRQALIDAGGIEQVKEEIRDVRAGASLDILRNDVRIAARGLIRSPVFTLTTLLTLSLGLGATIVVAAIADAVLVRPLPYKDANRLVTVLGHGTDPVAPGNYLDWKAASTSFAQIEAAEAWSPTFTDGDAEQVSGLHVTPGMFEMLGASPALGPGFTRHVGGGRELLLSDGLWRRRFAADSSIIGRTVRLGKENFVVVGVMARGFQFAPFWVTNAQLWAPLSLEGKSADRGASSLRLFARLKPGVTLAAAQRDVDLITGRLAVSFPESNRDIRVTSLKEKAIGNARPALIAVLAAVALVLLITWINIAHMLLARAVTRERELGMRVALGASRGRVVREALTVAMLLSTIGGSLALALASFALSLITARGPFDLPQLATLGLDGRIGAIAVALVIVTTLFAASLPGWLASRAAVSPTLRFNARAATAGAGRARLRQILIASEMAFAVVLLVGTSLAIRSFVAMRSIDPGFDSRDLITMQMPLPRTASTAERRIAYFNQVRAELEALPGVRGAGFINHLPLAGDEWGAPAFGGTTENVDVASAPRSIYRVVTPGLLATMRVDLEQGRDVEATDDSAHAGVVIVNRRLASLLWPGTNAVGKQLSLGPPGAERKWRTVIGVAENVKQSSWTSSSEPEMYIPYAQARGYLDSESEVTGYLTLVVRHEGDAAAVIAAARRIAKTADPTAPVTHIEAMGDVVDHMTARARFIMSVLVAFGALAVTLAAIGIYGVMSYSIAQRRQEIGIRIALGATPRSISAQVLRQTVIISAAGLAAGGFVAVVLARLVASQLYGIQPEDPASFAMAGLTIAAVALVASLGPVLRATRIDPLRAIRAD